MKSSDESAASRTLRVLYVDYSLGFGGAVKSLSLTLRAMPAIQKLIVTSQERGIIEHWFGGLDVRGFRRVVNYRSRQRFDDRLPAGPVRWLGRKLFAALDMAAQFANAIRLALFVKLRGVHLVHLNNGFVPYDALLAAEWTGVPALVHLRDFQRERHVVAMSASRRVAMVVGVSNAVVESAVAAGVPRETTATLYDPVDLDAIVAAESERDRIRAEWRIGRGDVAFGIFGRVIPWKGQREFAEAAIEAIRRNPRILAVIVGDESDGDPRYFEAIRERVRAAGIEHRFVYTGYRADVEAHYAAMDVVVHASVTPEPFGMVVPEAMAAAKPVIAADAGGPHEIVTHGTDGLLVPPGDVAAMTSAMLTLATDDALRSRMGQSGRLRAADFGIEANAVRIAALYERIMAQHVDGSALNSARP